MPCGCEECTFSKVVSASVNYIRSECGMCLTRGQRLPAGVNQFSETSQRRREQALESSGVEVQSAGQPGRAQTERRTETGSFWKHCTNAQQSGVNK
jgi:hypothetical protein